MWADQRVRCVIQPYTGDKLLHQLDLVPVRYLPNADEIRARLIVRGNQYYELNQGPAMQDYMGSVFPRVFKDVRLIFIAGQNPAHLEFFFREREIYTSHKSFSHLVSIKRNHFRGFHPC